MRKLYIQPSLLLVVATFLLNACDGGGAPTVPNPLPPPVPPPPPPSAAIQRVFTQISFASPIAMMQAPGDTTRWFVAEQRGIVRVFNNTPNVAASSVYLDIVARVDSVPNEAGLLGMAFHPDFQANQQVFVSYTRGGPLTSVVSRFTVDQGTGLPDPTSEYVILTVPQPAGNHNGGNIAFGPDGNLYIGFVNRPTANAPDRTRNNEKMDCINVLGCLTNN